MKTEHLPLVVAIVAAAASIAGVAYTQYSALRLERAKWELNQAELRRKALTDSIVAYGRDLSIALQRAEFLTWTASNDPAAVDAAMLAEYDKAAVVSLSNIATSRLLVAAQDAQVAAQVDAAALAYYKVDECVAKARTTFRRSQQEARLQLGTCKDQAAAATEAAFKNFRSVLASIPSSRPEK